MNFFQSQKVMRMVEALEGKGFCLPLMKGEVELAEKLAAITRQVGPLCYHLFHANLCVCSRNWIICWFVYNACSWKDLEQNFLVGSKIFLLYRVFKQMISVVLFFYQDQLKFMNSLLPVCRRLVFDATI